jgi:hypothetical protein
VPESQPPPLTADALGQLLRAVEPAVLLLPPRLLRRVIKHDRNVAGLGLQVPHRKSYVTPRDHVLRIADRQELGLGPDAELPTTVILIARPGPESLAAVPSRGAALVKYWRILFHACVHRDLERQLAERGVTETGIRQRVRVLGPAEFQEAHAVLRQDNYLLPPRDDRETYVEFAAVYLELRHFAPQLLPAYFPGVRCFERIDLMLAEDTDAERLLAATRLPGAPDPLAVEERGPAPVVAAAPQPPADRASWFSLFRRAMRRAKKAGKRGNVVRAAISRTVAATVAVADQAESIRAEARADLRQLVHRLQQALGFDSRDADRWNNALQPLLGPAADGFWPVEARLLYDLQKVCIDHERSPYAFDMVGWLVSLGRRPLRRALPCQQLVLVLRHLRTAARRVPLARIGERDRHHLDVLLHEAIEHWEEQVRCCVRPKLRTALVDVGMVPANLPEQVALNKLVEELLDRVEDRGYLTMGDLRDAVSRNNLKLPDLGTDDPAAGAPARSWWSAAGATGWRLLASAREFLLGDRLIQANRRLARDLDGVYHRGEIYLRWLQRLSALAFGTQLGRLLTLYLALPFGGAFVLLEGIQEIANVVLNPLTGQHVHIMHYRQIAGLPTGTHVSVTTLGLGTFLLLLMAVPAFRNLVLSAGGLLYRGLRGLFIDLPRFLVQLPAVRRVLESWPVVLFRRHLLPPLGLALGIGAILSLAGVSNQVMLAVTAGVFAVLFLFLNTRLGRDVEEAVTDWAVRAWHRVSFDLLPGLFRMVMGFFRQLVESVDRFLYRVDEWLRFRRGDSRLTLLWKPVVGVVWFGVTYVVRIYVNLFIEPTFNPIKHFPVVTVAAKLMLPFDVPLARYFTGLLAPILAPLFREERTAVVLAGTVATINVFLIPGIFGFLVWELKENWRLYQANRPRQLKPVVIGHHGETMLRLLRPGLHSGTIPKLYARLRKAERALYYTGEQQPVHHYEHSLHHVEVALRRFVEREFVSLLELSRRWGTALAVSEVGLATNRVRVTATRPGQTGCLEVAFEEHAGWLVAGVEGAEWLAGLLPEQRQALTAALAGLYKMAGVGLVRERIESCVGGEAGVDGVATAGPVTRSNGADRFYALPSDPALPQAAGQQPAPGCDGDELVFQHVSVTWERWVEVWEQDSEQGRVTKPLLEVRLLPEPEREELPAS